MGYLYGYFSTDPTYPEGVRCNIEAVYDPPQIGDQHGVQELDDPNIHKADMIASALGLERVGQIFTSNEQDMFLSADDTRKAARLQE
jgi:nuclear protein localization family protein 4